MRSKARDEVSLSVEMGWKPDKSVFETHASQVNRLAYTLRKELRQCALFWRVLGRRAATVVEFDSKLAGIIFRTSRA